MKNVGLDTLRCSTNTRYAKEHGCSTNADMPGLDTAKKRRLLDPPRKEIKNGGTND